MRLRTVWACLAVSAPFLLGGWAAPAGADVFGPIGLVSAGSIGGGELQQVEYAHDAVISSGGGYVVFDGSVGGATGVWRIDPATRQIQQVAGGDGLLPSVSADGRYVSFTTNEPEAELKQATRGLGGEPPAGEGSNERGAENVWVRDMNLAPNEPGAFTVASAPTGSGEPLSYGAEAGTERGSVASGGSAISADGQEVAFVTTALSNLVGPGTPALQVAVRRLATRETVLVSGEYEPATGQTTGRPVSANGFGAEYSFGAAAPAFPEAPPEYDEWGEARPPGASISADGGTVAWMGTNIGRQARMLPGESPQSQYTEPLWRRIAAPATPTQRVTGGSDPSAPGCAESGESALPSNPSPSDRCQGPFLTFPAEGGTAEGDTGIFSGHESAQETHGDFIPRLSADGYTVAFLSRAMPIGLAGRSITARERGQPPDVYVADMHPGLTRDAALTTLTQIVGVSGSEQAGISEFALSEDGRQLAFTTRRTQFRLAFPAFVSAPAAEPGLDELFAVDLTNGTLTRVSHGYAGEPSEQPHNAKAREQEDAYEERHSAGASSPSFADGGTLLAFSSTASNLVPGDGNGPAAFGSRVGPRDGSDAFLVARELPTALPTPQYVSPAPTTPTEPAWLLGATAVSRADGSVVLYVQVPGPGALRAAARSSIVTSKARGRGARKRATARKSSVSIRTVAAAAANAAALDGGLLALVLRKGGLSATVSIAFSAAGHSELFQNLAVTFLGKAATARHHAGSSSRHRRTSRR
jgi:hypothetical protein